MAVHRVGLGGLLVLVNGLVLACSSGTGGGTLVVTSAASCPGAESPPIDIFVEADAQALTDTLRLAADDVLDNPSRDEVVERVRNHHSGPLFFIYSGNGQVIPQRDSQVSSALCLEDGELLEVNALLDAIPPKTPWATFVINGCESADVNASRNGRALSLITASTDLAHATENDADYPGTPLVHELVNVLSQRTDPRRNGLLTDSDLFHHLESKLHPGRTRHFVRLQRNSSSELPVLRLGTEFGAEEVESLARQAGDQELSVAVRTQVALAGSQEQLPDSPTNFLIVRDEDLELTELAALGLRRLDLGRDAATRLARFSTFSEFFEVATTGDERIITRLRDTQELGRSRVGNPDALVQRLAVQQPNTVVRSCLSGHNFMARFLRGVPLGQTLSVFDVARGSVRKVPRNALVPTPCPGREGQCFFAMVQGDRADAGPDTFCKE